MKPFKGVISNWHRDGNVIVGRCQYHPEMQNEITLHAVMNDAIVRDQEMHTGRIGKIEDRGSFQICETKNSFYILIEPREHWTTELARVGGHD